jgi:hypothetical protein
MARKVNVWATIRGLDDEIFGDEKGEVSGSRETIVYQPGTTRLLDLELKFGGEIRVNLTVRGMEDWNYDDHHLIVWAQAWLYEGTSEDTDDLDGEIEWDFSIPPHPDTEPSGNTPQGTGSGRRLWNQQESKDYADINVWVLNQQFVG